MMPSFPSSVRSIVPYMLAPPRLTRLQTHMHDTSTKRNQFRVLESAAQIILPNRWFSMQARRWMQAISDQCDISRIQ